MNNVPQHFTQENEVAVKFGVHEIILSGNGDVENPFLTEVLVTFIPPSGTKYQVSVFAFYDGGHTWRARVYVTEAGTWHWTTTSDMDETLNGEKESFTAVDSNLRGMLRKHPQHPKQWMTNDQKWFLNINDTAYFLFRSQEPLWKEYVKDNWELGVTSVRAGSLGTIDWEEQDVANILSEPNLLNFQTTDQRLQWMLCHYPGMYVQLILFGLKSYGQDDTGEAWKSIPRNERRRIMHYMISRWAAFPQIFWLVVNDMHCDENFPLNAEFAREVGQFFKENDPYQHLLSSGPKREQRFPFTVPSHDDWVSYIHIEDRFEFGAEKVELYESYPLHVFHGEDIYEQDRGRRDPKHPQYFYRRLFWSWLLSGGSANYGGRWDVLHPYSQTHHIPYSTKHWIGSEDFNNHTQGLVGLNSIIHIKHFLEQRELDLSLFQVANQFVHDLDGREGIDKPHLMRREDREIIIYHPHAILKERETKVDPSKAATMKLNLTFTHRTFQAEWFRARDGVSKFGSRLQGNASYELESPWIGEDVVLYLYEANQKK